MVCVIALQAFIAYLLIWILDNQVGLSPLERVVLFIWLILAILHDLGILLDIRDILRGEG